MERPRQGEGEHGREKDEEGMDDRRKGPAQRIPRFQPTPNPLFISFPSPHMDMMSPLTNSLQPRRDNLPPSVAKFSPLARQIHPPRSRRGRLRRAAGRERWRLDRCGRCSSGRHSTWTSTRSDLLSLFEITGNVAILSQSAPYSLELSPIFPAPSLPTPTPV